MLNKIFYTLKPAIPRRFQIFLRRQLIHYKMKNNKRIWPIDPKAGETPRDWQGWPDNKKFALLLSHDVDTQRGHDNCLRLMEIEKSLGFRSCFNIVPEKYRFSMEVIETLKGNGFEVCVHGLKHDGKLFRSRKIFNKRAERINYYLKMWDSIGFTSPSMHHNLEWMHALNIQHATTTFDTDPFEPQPHSIRTIFPFWVSNSRNPQGGYVELPLTLPQDHLLFVILQNKYIDIWKKKIDWIAEKGGMVLVNTHPDYMNFNERIVGLEEYFAKYYREFLEYIKTIYKDQYWHVVPNELANFWKSNMVDHSLIRLSQ